MGFLRIRASEKHKDVRDKLTVGRRSDYHSKDSGDTWRVQRHAQSCVRSARKRDKGVQSSGTPAAGQIWLKLDPKV